MQKTFKIGEYAIGGIIKIKTHPKNAYRIECIDMESKEVIKWAYVYGVDSIESYLEENITTPYHASIISDYFKNRRPKNHE